jgi:hypothetical protein
MTEHGFQKICAIITSALLLTGSLALAEPIANLGTLTCTVDPGTKEPFGVERELSCSFEPIVGSQVTFVGVVKRLGADVAGHAKIVLVWSVLGPSVDTPVKQLEGRYLGSLASERDQNDAAGLVGGANANIRLKPLTLDPQLGGNAALSVLELELAAMRA